MTGFSGVREKEECEAKALLSYPFTSPICNSVQSELHVYLEGLDLLDLFLCSNILLLTE